MQRLFSFFFPFLFPIEWSGYPSPPRKATAQKKVFQQLAPRFGRIGKLWDCTTNQRHNRGTFRIPSHSNTPSYRQQVRALFRYISSSRFSCGYFGMHSYFYQHLHCRKGKASRPLHPIAHGIVPSATPTFLLCSLSTFLYSPLIHNFTFPFYIPFI